MPGKHQENVCEYKAISKDFGWERFQGRAKSCNSDASTRVLSELNNLLLHAFWYDSIKAK